MSWKLKLKQKRFSIALLAILLISLAFNVYGYYSIYTQSIGKFKIQLSANTEMKLQLDSQTYMVIHAQTAFNASGYWLTTTDTTGDLEFEANAASVLNFYWFGNVSNVEWGRITIGMYSISNYTDHSISSGGVYRLMWNWLGYSVVPPPSQYEIFVYGIMLNEDLAVENWLMTSLNNAITFTVTTNSEFTTTYNTTAIFNVDSNSTYLVTFPTLYNLNETYDLQFLNVTQVSPDSGYSTTSNSFTFIPSNNMDFFVYYKQVPHGPMQPYLPINFILGMIGLASLIGGATYGTIKIKNREIDQQLLFALFLTGAGYALFITWLWPAVGALII